MAYRLKDIRKISKLKILIVKGLFAAAVVSCCSITNKEDETTNSLNLKNGKFINAVPNKEYSFSEYVKMSWEFFFGGNDGRVPQKSLPVVAPEEFQTPPASAIQYTWLGHSSLILELEGKRFLLDPVFSERASFSGWVGPKRFHPTPISLEDLPHMEAVLISHNHYDHLDRMVIEHIKGKDALFYVPLGIAELRDKEGAYYRI